MRNETIIAFEKKKKTVSLIHIQNGRRVILTQFSGSMQLAPININKIAKLDVIVAINEAEI